MFVAGRKYKATQDLWELLTKSKPDRNVVTFQDRQAYKQILLQSNYAELIIVPQVSSKQTKASNLREQGIPLKHLLCMAEGK